MLRVLVAVVAATGAIVAGTANADQLTWEQLAAAGWTCFHDPVLPRMVCSDPGHGRPPLNPTEPGRPSYSFKIFSSGDGTFLGTLTLIRADLYQGQPCPAFDGPYVFIPPIGYYKCEHF